MTINHPIIERDTIKVLEATPDAMIMVDEEGKIVYGNPQAIVMFGYQKDELLGLSVESLMPETYRLRHVKHRGNFLVSPHVRPMGTGMALYGLKKNQEVFPVEISLSPLEHSDGVMVLAAVRDISDRKRTEKKLAELNRQLQESSRTAGMAETANLVLHHLGNILTSLHVSLDNLLQQTKQQRVVTECQELVALMNENINSLAQYLQKDSKGKLIPEYLKTLGERIGQEYTRISKEILYVQKKLNTVTEIVFEQQLIGKTPIIDENFSIVEKINSAIEYVDFKDSHINIEIDTGNVTLVCADKNKVTQILINLILNAKQSLLLSKKNNKVLSITVRENESKIEICIKDNGIGIAADNILKIFSFGFITKEGRHGYGLQNAAYMATKMGGTLYATSEGIDKGASFILALPLKLC